MRISNPVQVTAGLEVLALLLSGSIKGEKFLEQLSDRNFSRMSLLRGIGHDW
jgi:hypothetical protein